MSDRRLSTRTPRKRVSRYFGLLFAFIFSSSISFARVVIIDPGHGGEDSGASAFFPSLNKKLLEKDIVLVYAQFLKKALEEKNIKVILTRQEDLFLSLQQRAALSHYWKADLFLSLHLNSSEDPKIGGLELFYLTPNSKEVREKIQKEAISGNSLYKKTPNPSLNSLLTEIILEHSVLSSKFLASKIGSTLEIGPLKEFGITFRGIGPELFYVLAFTQRPSLLIEIGFFSNPEEREKLLLPEFQEQWAKAVAQGIELFFEEKVQDISLL